MVSRITSKVVVCKGGLILDQDVLTQGTVSPGSAKTLQNYEAALEGGYRRIDGFAKYSDSKVTANADKILGVKVAFDGVFAYAKANTSDYRLYHSTGSTWTDVSGSFRSTAEPLKARFVSYHIGEERVVMVDGKDEAIRYTAASSGSSTLIDGSGSGSGTPPADPRFCEFFLGRLCLAGYSSNPSAVTLSAPNDDLKFAAVDGAVEINVGDEIVQIKSFRDELYVFCKNSLYKIVEDVSTTFALEDITKSIGCIASDSVQEIGGDLVFLAPDGIRSIAATERIGDIELALLSRTIQPVIRPVIRTVSPDDFSSCVIRGKSQYRLFKYNASLTNDASRVGIIGKLENGQAGINFEWSTTAGIPPYSCDSYYEDDNEVVVFGHHSNGYVYNMESGNSFDGENITSIYETPDMTLDDASIRKMFRKLIIYTRAEGNIETDIFLVLDQGESGKLQPPKVSISGNGGAAVYGLSRYGTDSYGGLVFPTFKKNLHGTGYVGSFKYIASVNDAAPHRIDSFQIEYSIKGRK